MSRPDRLFDRALLARRRNRALSGGRRGADFLMKIAVEDTLDRLSAIKRTFDVAIDLGGHGGLLAASLRTTPAVGSVVRADSLVADPSAGGPDLVVDEEALPFADGSADLVISLLQAQAVNDLPGLFVQVNRVLRPDGLFLAVMAGGDTLHELKGALTAAEAELIGGASPRCHPSLDLQDTAALLQRAGMAIPVADVDRYTVRYSVLGDLVADLRAMGATNVLAGRDRRPLPRSVLARAEEIYRDLHADPDGRLRATFDLIALSGWRPHESQQKPLKPGSAKTRLADALGATEQPAGEKAPGRDPSKT
ncbi:methyltransferase domain-containing protein [Amorphus coralli]|uniref:methyltransferase domain-containing protein n=1 Tax=Amorphus coralli TaxID=340680 RepID=UPI00037DC7C9|nr:methyltransferase domain-containing protein [Amorphus coralli]